MKREVFRLFALVAVIGLAASCGGGGDEDKAYEFGGRWVHTWTVTSSTVSGIAVGAIYQDILIISQDGNNVTVKYESTGDNCIMRGTGDPNAKTFSATGICTGAYEGVRNDLSGTGVDDDSMSGTQSISAGGRAATGGWTVDLTTRTLAASNSRGGVGDMSSLLLKAIQ